MRTSEGIMNIIKERMKELRLSQSELSRRTKISRSAMSRYFKGERGFPLDKTNEFAQALDLSPEYLIDVYHPENVQPVSDKIVEVPIIGSIACGDPITAEENVNGYLPMLRSSLPEGTNFYLRCEGDSMEPKIPNGALVLIHSQPMVENNEIAAVLIDGDATLKRVKKIGNDVLLMPENNKYNPIKLTEDKQNRIIGKAIGAFNRF